MNWWAAACLLGLGLFFCAGAILMIIKAYRLHRYSINAQGRVVNKEAQPHMIIRSTVEFTDQDGQPVTFNTIHSIGDNQVLVAYLPHKPRKYSELV
jgi:hypothetical protein